jgi:hypothetical protein
MVGFGFGGVFGGGMQKIGIRLFWSSVVQLLVVRGWVHS